MEEKELSDETERRGGKEGRARKARERFGEERRRKKGETMQEKTQTSEN